jgi:hypothetical protein
MNICFSTSTEQIVGPERRGKEFRIADFELRMNSRRPVKSAVMPQ